MDVHCPHCGARLTNSRDAFCGECRADLSDPPAAAQPVLPPPSAAEVAADQDKAMGLAIVMSIAVYAILIGTLFAPDVRAKLVEAFGPRPLGVPTSVFAVALQTLLYLPMPRAFYHFGLIGVQASREGEVLFGLRSFAYVEDVGRRYPHLARSRRICLGSLGYFVAVVAVWIVYTSVLGI